MHDTDELEGFEQRLLVELREVVRATARSEERPAVGASAGWWRRPLLVPALGVAVLALVAVLAGPSIVTPNRPGVAAFAVETLPDGRIHVTVAADFDDRERLEKALRDAGVKVEVIRIAAHPALAGTIEFPDHQLPPGGVERGKGEFWIDPARFDGTVEVLIYVAPDPGQEWTQGPSVFHPDEPLGGLPCALSGPLDTATLERRARDVGITTFEWLVTEGDPGRRAGKIERTSKRPEGEVEHAQRIGPRMLRVVVRPAEVVQRYGHARPPSMNQNLHTSTEPPCTPELAARWGS